MSNDDLGTRMKDYEAVTSQILTRRMPKILRLDGRAFHTVTRKCEKPFDKNLMYFMDETAIELCKEVQGAKMAYIQSDEISVLINDYQKLGSETWFNSNIQKMTSISAAVASVKFSLMWNKYWNTDNDHIHFDARAFILPEREVNNYMIFRQKDWERNSIQMLTRSHFSHKEMSNKKIPDMHEMLYTKGVNWNNIPIEQKRGRCAIKTINGWVIDHEIPTFHNDPYYIEQHIHPDEET